MKAAAVAVVRYVFPVIGKLVPAAKLGVSETVSSLALTTRTQRSTLLLGLNFVKSKSPQYSVPVVSILKISPKPKAWNGKRTIRARPKRNRFMVLCTTEFGTPGLRRPRRGRSRLVRSSNGRHRAGVASYQLSV